MYIPKQIKTKEKNGKRYLSKWERFKWIIRLRIAILLHDFCYFIPQDENTTWVHWYERVLLGDFEYVEHRFEREYSHYYPW